jgi:hypothetical protein
VFAMPTPMLMTRIRYIFKQPLIGGEATSHQDSCFLFTTPRQTCIGLWLALQPATLANGCLWLRPGSHTEPVRRHMARNPAYFGGSTGSTGGDNSDKAQPTAGSSPPMASSEPPPQMVFREFGRGSGGGGGSPAWAWGALPSRRQHRWLLLPAAAAHPSGHARRAGPPPPPPGDHVHISHGVQTAGRCMGGWRE